MRKLDVFVTSARKNGGTKYLSWASSLISTNNKRIRFSVLDERIVEL